MSEKSLPADKVLSQLGLACKAGRIVSGEFMTEKAVKEGKAFLVIVAEDASDNTKKHFNDMCNYRNIPIVSYSEKNKLAKAIGKEERASLAVTDDGFAQSILKKIKELQELSCRRY